MRRVFVIRKDLHLKPGKLAAMVGHCAETYWTNLLKAGSIKDNEFEELRAIETYPDGKKIPMLYHQSSLCEAAKKAFEEGKEFFLHKLENSCPTMTISIEIPKDIWNNYVNGIFTKTICEARNLDNMKKRVMPVIEELSLKEGIDYGYINDSCKTDLIPENPDGTCTIGMWFKPLPDEIAHKISKKFQLYRDESGKSAASTDACNVSKA